VYQKLGWHDDLKTARRCIYW